jgi:hypothetical protein
VVEEIDLFQLVIEVDDELIQEGAEPWQRPLMTYMRIAQRLQPGSSAIWQYDPLFKAVDQIYAQLYAQLYRETDLNMPSMHAGALMFRDIFFPLRIPRIFGSPSINPADFLTDVPEMQKTMVVCRSTNWVNVFRSGN